MLAYYTVESVAVEESSHVVKIFVVGHEVGRVVTCFLKSLRHTGH